MVWIDSIDGKLTGLIILSAGTLLASIVKGIFEIWKDKRNHNWAIEESERAIAANLLASKLLASHQSTVIQKLDDNTDLTKEVGVQAAQAYEEANTVNHKLEAMGVEIQSKLDGQIKLKGH
jgi:hypothetical protein